MASSQANLRGMTVYTRMKERNAILLRKSQNFSDKKENTIQQKHLMSCAFTAPHAALILTLVCATMLYQHMYGCINYAIFLFISIFFRLALPLSLGFVTRKPCCCCVFFVMNFFYSHGHKSKDDHLRGIKVHGTDVTYFTRQISLEPTTGQKVSIFFQEVSRPSKINNGDSQQQSAILFLK